MYNPKEEPVPTIPPRRSSKAATPGSDSSGFEPPAVVVEDEFTRVASKGRQNLGGANDDDDDGDGDGYIVASTHDSDGESEDLPPLPPGRPPSTAEARHGDAQAPPALPPQSDSESDDSDHDFGGFASTHAGSSVGQPAVDEDGFQRVPSVRGSTASSAVSAESYHSGFTADTSSAATPGSRSSSSLSAGFGSF